MSSSPSPSPYAGGVSHQYIGGIPLPEKVLTLPLEEKARVTVAEAPRLKPLEGIKKAVPPSSSAPLPPAKDTPTLSAKPNLLDDILKMKNPPPAKEKGAGIPVSKRLNPNQGIIRF
jgi:hypothetical protein